MNSKLILNFLICIETGCLYDPTKEHGLPVLVSYKSKIDLMLQNCLVEIRSCNITENEKNDLLKIHSRFRSLAAGLNAKDYSLQLRKYRPCGIFSDVKAEEERVNKLIHASVLNYHKELLSKILSALNEALQIKSECSSQQTVELPKRSSEDFGDARLISGVRNLAAYLGIGVTKAQEIINTKVLEEAGISYCVGRKKLYNREKLDELIREKPNFLKKVHRK